MSGVSSCGGRHGGVRVESLEPKQCEQSLLPGVAADDTHGDRYGPLSLAVLREIDGDSNLGEAGA